MLMHDGDWNEGSNHPLFLQGDMVWRLDGSMMMEPGYPKPLTSEFPGLRGRISAALTVPATGSTLEAVFFFKNGKKKDTCK